MTSFFLKNSHGSVEQICLSDDVDGLNVKYSHGSALISLHGGQLLKWQPKNQQPVFWLSDDAYYVENKAIRGGIPICWPWFGRHSDDVDNNAINHGFARLHRWQVDTVELTAEQIKVVLSLKTHNAHDFFPFANKLQQTFIFSNSGIDTLNFAIEPTFEHTLAMTNLSDQEVFYTGALHSYFAVSSPENTTIKALEGLTFDDMLTGEYCSTTPLENCVGSIDRNYHRAENSSNESMVINDSGWQRKITISATNSKQWILWNPGVDIASQMNDVHDGGEHEFVCLEVANTQKKKIPANETVTLGQTIKVSNY